MSRGTLDPASCLWISCTGFSPSVIGLPRPFHYPKAHILQSVTPKVFLPLVWPLPRSLATTDGISVDVFSSPYLDVSVQAVPDVWLCIHHTTTEVFSARFPHSEICGSIAYLQLPAAFRSLSRLSSALSAKASTLRSL